MGTSHLMLFTYCCCLYIFSICTANRRVDTVNWSRLYQSIKTSNTNISQWQRIPSVPDNAQVSRHGHFGGIIPLEYRLRIRTPISANHNTGSNRRLTFNGSVSILLRTEEPAPFIYLHAQNLEIPTDGVTLRKMSGTGKHDVPLVHVKHDKAKDVLIIQPQDRLREFKRYQLKIPAYSGRVNPGFSMGMFTGFVHQSQTRHSFTIATQFQLNAARTVFPCIDMPHFKANLTLSLVHPPNMLAFGNMAARDIYIPARGGWTETRFHTTPKIPTYTMGLALVPNIYRRVEAHTNDNIKLSLHYSAYHVDYRLAVKLLSYAKHSMNKLEQMLRIPLGLEKIDLIMLPQFMVQGMENFGMITLNEAYLSRQKPAYRLSLIAHELVHQWFSNIVTCKGWEYICFQEGLTDHLAREIVKSYFKDKQDWDKYYLDKYLTAIADETAARPPRNLLTDPNPTIPQVSKRCFGKAVFLFDSLERLVGREVFLTKINQFLTQFRDSHYTVEDFSRLFDDVIIDGARGKIPAYINYWYFTEGYPSLGLSRNYNNGDVRLDQMHIYPKITQRQSSYIALNNIWPMPMQIRLQSSNWNNLFKIFNSSLHLWRSVPLGHSDWLLANEEAAYFYRVNYDTHNWQLLANQLNKDPEVFKPVTRAQIVGDFCFFFGLGLVANAHQIRFTMQNAIFRQRHKFPDYAYYFVNCL